MHLQKGLHFAWQFILLTKHISSHIPSHSVDKCMLSNTLFPAFDEKHILFRFRIFLNDGVPQISTICSKLSRGVKIWILSEVYYFFQCDVN